MSRVVRILVRGRVQGVGYRYFTAAEARRQGVAGWVRNLASGDVEVLARLDDLQEAAFLEALRRGPPASGVTRLDVEPHPNPDDAPRSGFEIRR